MNTSEKIKLLSVDEMSVVHDLAYAIWPETFKDILSPEQISYMLDWMYNIDTLEQQAKKGHLFYAYLENNVAFGFIGVEVNCPTQGSMKIHKIYVLPQTQGTGIGKKLIKKAIDIGEERGIQTLVLNVNRYNKAIRFYEHLGFKIIGEENIDIGNGYWMEDFVMNYEL